MAAEKEDPCFSACSQYVFNLSDSLALEVFSSCYPQNLKTAALQKGLILSCRGAPVVGEGTGFGVPIVKYSDETLFSGSASVYVSRRGDVVEVQKDFFMDLIARDGFRNLKLESPKIRMLIDYISALYQRHAGVAKSILTLKPLLFKFGVNSRFISAPSRGKVTVTYVLGQRRVLVKLDFTQLSRVNFERVFVLNEQGADFFRAYLDSDDVRLVDGEIGVWDTVTAESAKIVDEQGKVGFSLKAVEGACLRRGREMRWFFELGWFRLRSSPCAELF